MLQPPLRPPPRQPYPATAPLRQTRTGAPGCEQYHSSRGMRGRVAERMFQSWNTIPRVTEVMQVDMSATVAFREAMLGQWEQQYGLRYFAERHDHSKTVVAALRRQPRLNATLVDQEVRLHDSVERGHCREPRREVSSCRSFLTLTRRIWVTSHGRGVTWRRRHVLVASNSTRSVMGRLHHQSRDDGHRAVHPHYQSPQVAILGVGMVQRRPIVVGDALAIRPAVYSPGLRPSCRGRRPSRALLAGVKTPARKPQNYALS